MNRKKITLRSFIGIAAATLGAIIFLVPPALAQAPSDQVAAGKYLVEAGDCVACHTAPGGKPFAGGLGISTPFGTIYSPNITPDNDTGIGTWTEADLARALKQGLSKNGAHLYPVFPYTYFSRITGEDSAAIYAYLRTLQPVSSQIPANKLQWPLGNRIFARAWNLLFFRPVSSSPQPGKSPQWNRGAYLVEGLGHCGACHTPKNWLGADRTSALFKGGKFEDWFAPNVTDDALKGLNGWSVDDIAEYLQTGRNTYAQAGGPMGEVVQYSTSHMTRQDIEAIALYLKGLPGEASKPATQSVSTVERPSGEAIYLDQCSACHRSSGTGIAQMFPALAGASVAVQDDPSSMIRAILVGARTVPTDAKPTPSSMPAYFWKLSDDEIAAVATYVRNHWGNSASVVSADAVTSIRKNLNQPAPANAN
jgi:mono/diheme cytochrome c family protein